MPAQQKLLRSVGLLSLCSVGQMVLQIAIQILLARLFGATAQMDAFNAAIRVPGVISTVVAGVLPAVLIPVLIHRREELGPQQANETASLVGMLMAVGLGAVCFAGFWTARPLLAALQPGFSTEQVSQSARMFRVLVLLIGTQSFAAFLQAVSHAERRFVLPAIAPVAGGALTVVWIWARHSSEGIDAVTTGVVAGSLVTVGVQVPAFLRGWKFPMEWDRGTSQVLMLAWPLLLCTLYCKLDPVVDLYLAARMQMPEGSLAHLGYAGRIVGVLLTLSTSGLAVVVFPVLSRYAVGGHEREMKAEIVQAFRFLIFALGPIATGLALFHRPILRDLLERGEFTARDSEIVGTLVVLSLGVLLAGSAGEILSRIFFAMRDTRTPLIIGVVGFTLGVLLKWPLAGAMGLNGLVLATSAYYVLNAVVQFCVLSARLGSLIPPDLMTLVGRAAFGSAGAAAAAYAVLQFSFPLVLLAAATGAGLVYVALTGWAGDEFARSLLRGMRR